MRDWTTLHPNPTAAAMNDDPRRWRPRHKRALLVAPLDAGGQQGGIFVPEDDRRNKMMGYVLAARDCLEVQPDDIVTFEEGASEVLVTGSGETIHWLAETRVTAIDPDLWPKPQPESTTAGGLVLPGRA